MQCEVARLHCNGNADRINVRNKGVKAMVPAEGVEPSTFALRMRCSTN